jgi:hemolysin III
MISESVQSESRSLVLKPLLRGHFHQAAFFIALGACAMLLAQASNSDALGAIIVYSLCLCGLLGISALYHRPQWQPNARMWMKRLDHAAIFLLIAGTGTPLALLGIPGPTGEKLRNIFWLVAVVGIFQSLFWVKAPKWVSAVLYVGMGWLALPYLTELKSALGSNGIALLVAGGVVYTVGAVIYAMKKPNPWPVVFGYHEIFHVLVVVAAAFHFVCIYLMLP